MRKRAAIYARFSTDLQSDRSIDDQVALCRRWADRNSYEVVAEYSDRARTGTSILGRDGLLRLMDDARAGAFDAIVVEELDRLSRDQEDLPHIHKRMTHIGVEIVSVHKGTADALQVGLNGLISTMFIADLKHKIRRGMSGVIRDGRHAGGKAYGYRPVPGQPGVLAIEETEAAVVRRIFDEYAAGKTPREIARGLNAAGIPAPRGTSWNASTINGSRARGTGILRNELYVGSIVWNRVRMVRDPDTGRRISRVNSTTEVERRQAPGLAIVSPEVFEAVERIRASRRSEAQEGRYVRAPRRLLSGLLRCGHCGGGMAVQGTRNSVTRVRCSRAVESGTCSNRRAYRLERIERAVIDRVAASLAHPDLIKAYVGAYRKERMRDAVEAQRSRVGLERRLSQVKGQSGRLVDLYTRETTMAVSTFEERHGPLETERLALERELSTVPVAPVIELHPQALAKYERVVDDLAGRLAVLDLAVDREAIDRFRDLIDHVTVLDAPNSGVIVETVGRLSALLGRPAGDVGGKVVAEEGLEPPTRGL